MDARKRILVVEDMDIPRESYVQHLEMQNYKVNGAGTLKDAIEFIDSNTYHVAIVDIMLIAEEATNRDGAEVVRHIRQIDEGTEVIVFSWVEDDPQLERDFFKEFNIFDFIPKKREIPHLLKRVKAAIDAGRVDAPLTWEKLVETIGWPIDSEHFTAECLTRLEFKGGFQTLSRTLITACKAFVPLLRQNNGDRALVFDQQRGVYHGSFWSKAQGMAIELLFWGKNVSGGSRAPESLLTGRSVLYPPKEKAGLSVAIAALPNLSRADFSDGR